MFKIYDCEYIGSLWLIDIGSKGHMGRLWKLTSFVNVLHAKLLTNHNLLRCNHCTNSFIKLCYLLEVIHAIVKMIWIATLDETRNAFSHTLYEKINHNAFSHTAGDDITMQRRRRCWEGWLLLTWRSCGYIHLDIYV